MPNIGTHMQQISLTVISGSVVLCAVQINVHAQHILVFQMVKMSSALSAS